MGRRRAAGRLTAVPRARAVEFAAPRRVEVVDVDLPPLAEGDVLVHTRCSGLSAGTELLAYRGEIDPDLPLDETIGALAGTFRFPFRFGYSCVGVVEESRAADVSIGSPVFAFHPHQDRFVVPATSVVALPDVEPRIAALFPLVETALQITLDAAPLLDEPVVVLGLGAVGILTAAMLRRAGARVVAGEPLAWRREVAASLGVESVEPEELGAVLATLGAGDGVAVVVEVSGNPPALDAGLRLLRHEGTALVASWYGTKPVALMLGAEFHRRRLTIRSTQVSTIPAHLSGRWTIERRRRAAVDLLGELDLAAVATHTFPFERAGDAFAALDSGADGLVHAALWYQ
jgi:2-desacetyl-2-hydroxyethyl bacteriochlorophyllide A dehydrogenase